MQQIQLSHQIGPTGEDLLAGWLIVRRYATDGRSDVGIMQNEAVIPCRALRLIGESSLPHRPIEKLAGAVAGKHASGTVCAMRSGSESDDQQPRIRIAEPGHGTAPIGLSAIRSPLHAPDLFPVGDQPQASEAVDDFVVENWERIQNRELSPAIIIR